MLPLTAHVVLLTAHVLLLTAHCSSLIRLLPAEGYELFGSSKKNYTYHLDHSNPSWMHDKVNDSIPHMNTMSMRARIDESFKHDKNVVSHTTFVLELEWHES
jgi:hypothetical protein